MRYWYAPLRRPPGDLFTTNSENARAADPLYVGEITKVVYDRMMFERTIGSEFEDEFGLPTLDADDPDL